MKDSKLIKKNTMFNIVLEQQTNQTLSKKYDSTEDAIRISLREVGMTPNDNAFDYDLMKIDDKPVLSPSKNASNWVAAIPFIAEDIKLDEEYSENNSILFFMDGSPADLLYVDFSNTK